MPRKQPGSVAAQAHETFYISPKVRDLLIKVRGLITGVVTQVEAFPRQKGAILTIAVGQSQPLIILMRSPSTYFLGKMVILRPAKRMLYSAENPDEVFVVERAIHVPPPLRNSDFPLLLEGSGQPTSVDDDRINAKLNGQPKNVCKAYRKYLRFGLDTEWKAHELASIIYLLDDTTKHQAIHRAAVLSLEKFAQHGDASVALVLAKALHPQKRELLTRWYRRYSPIRIDLSRKDRKLRIVRAPDGSRPEIDQSAAMANPYFKRLPNNE